MKTHFETKGDFLVTEIVDEYFVFECDKGHKWDETLENRFGGLMSPIHLPVPDGDNLCPFCLANFLKGLGKVKTRTVRVG